MTKQLISSSTLFFSSFNSRFNLTYPFYVLFSCSFFAYSLFFSFKLLFEISLFFLSFFSISFNDSLILSVCFMQSLISHISFFSLCQAVSTRYKFCTPLNFRLLTYLFQPSDFQLYNLCKNHQIIALFPQPLRVLFSTVRSTHLVFVEFLFFICDVSTKFFILNYCNFS